MRYILRLTNKFLSRLSGYCNQLPILGYNSGKYDLNLIRKEILLQNGFTETQNSFIIKKNNGYLCISTPLYKFLDAANYLSVGTSYDAFLKSYDTEQNKSFFPYEWLDDIKKLELTYLPEYSAFYSNLKNENTLENEYNSYQSVLDEHQDDIAITLKALNLKTPPKTGLGNYNELKQLWKNNKWQTMKDFLIYYNNLDVIPFVEALEKMLHLYRENKIDLFKNCVTVPSAARHLLFTSVNNDVNFALISEKQKDIYSLFKNNIIGGPSIVMSRYHKKDETHIRNNSEKVCKSVIGYDANSLYPFAMAQNMPTREFIIRRNVNDFQPDESPRWLGAKEWLEWIEHENGIALQTMYNGCEKQIGPCKVDGWCESTNTIYEYYRCWWRGCECLSNDSNLDKKMLEQRLLRTQARAETLCSLGHVVFEIFECEWNRKRTFDDHVKTYFYQKQSPHFFLGMSTSDIIALVKNDSIFAAIECDISVPDTWPRGDITPYDYFSEMSPIFKTCNVSMDLIGDHMQKFMLDNGISNCDRRTLIGGMKAEKILLATPLLKWYIEHGMVVSDVYTVIEFTPKQCFKKFVDKVAFDRREADAGRKPKLQADTSKLIGNSAYGSMLLDPTKHRNIRYAQDLKKLSKQVNQPTFRHFDILDEEFFEIEHAKRQTVLNMQIQLGFFCSAVCKVKNASVLL